MPPSRSRNELKARLGHNLAPATTAADVLTRAADTLLWAVPADVWCGVLLDPSTLLDTGGVHHEGFPADVMPRLFEIEHVEQDGVDNVRALARRESPVSLLSASTGGDLASSTYYRDILAPLRLADELRVVLRDGARTWGLLVWCRATTPFTAADLAAAHAVVAPATEALRRSFLRHGTDTGTTVDGTGLVVVDADQRITHSTSTADRLLTELQEDGRPHHADDSPHTLRALAARARTAGPRGSVRSHAKTRSGAWISLTAYAMPADGAVTISVGPPDLTELTAIVLDAYALSPRHREVTELVLRGRSTEEIMAQLHLSRNTLAGYFTKIFDTVGVRSRSELAAHVFQRHYQPNLAHAPLALDGRLLLT
ncbi:MULTISPECIES: helix-turn-helix transcriptional regulator [unclassified Saccharothrix]|uniref:helix-turn-helix transcriptional regulator n=1 Tax=unclassified Saccharothrix TaxID=2593673 RepID=UPI00307DA4EC